MAIKNDMERQANGLSCIIWLGIMLMFLAACSVKFEIGYHGESAKDNRDFTSQAKK